MVRSDPPKPVDQPDALKAASGAVMSFLRLLHLTPGLSTPESPATGAHDPLADARALLDATPFGLALLGADRIVLFANAPADRLLGYAAGGLQGLHIDVVLRAGERDGEQSAVRADGSLMSVGVETRPLRLGERELMLLALTDLSSRRREAREADRLRDELAHLSRVAMLGDMSGALAHELNQPLSAILTNAQAGQRLLGAREATKQDAMLREILSDIVEDDRRAGDIIRQLRKWLRKEHLEHVPLSVNDVVLDVLHLVRSDLLHRGVDVQLELSGILPRVDGDRVLLQQVLLNLVLNGCDAMEGLPPPRQLRLRSRESIDGGVCVEVSDGGRGICPSILPSMFEPFETTKPEGMGMGLAVSRNIIESHKGRMSARSLPEGGACVGFELPASAP